MPLLGHEDLLGEARRVVDELATMGLAYQQAVVADTQSTTDATKHRRDIELEFERTMMPGPIPIVRALEMRGFGPASAAINALWENVFWVTSLIAVSLGVDETEVLEFDVAAKRDAAIAALNHAAETASDAEDEKSVRRAQVLTHSALVADEVMGLGTEYQSYIDDPLLPLDDDETNEEARGRVTAQFDQADAVHAIQELEELGLGSAADALRTLIAAVSALVTGAQDGDAPGQHVDLHAIRDNVVSELRNHVARRD